jgi:hypothetical protein
MVREGAGAGGFSFSTVLSGLTADADMAGGLQVHGQLVKTDIGKYIAITLLKIIARWGPRQIHRNHAAEGHQYETGFVDIVSWNTLLAGFARHSCAQMWNLWLRMVREGSRAGGLPPCSRD